MARPRTPTEVLELRGSFKHNPQRRRPVGAKSDQGLGDPPDCLNPEEAACWREMVGNAPVEILTSADRVLLEMAARLQAKFRDGWLTGTEMSLLLQCCTRLGWTPSDRSKVPVPVKPTEPSEWDEFAEFMDAAHRTSS